MPNSASPGALTVAADYWTNSGTSFGGQGTEFFGWSVLVLVSASEREVGARLVKGEKDEKRDKGLGVPL